MILTDRGEAPVEALKIGDHAITLSGLPRPIHWIGLGRTLVAPRNRCDVSPVIVRRGALADHVPDLDLYVTRRHALLIGDVLVPVEHLINGVSILWDDRPRVIEYYHVELGAHDVLIANGAPAESFRDDGARELFQNEFGRPRRSAPALPCKPIINHGEPLERAWRTVASRLGKLPVDWLTSDPGVHLLVDGHRIEPFYAVGDVVRFRIDRPRGEICIGSRSCIPEAHGLGDDTRRLGVGLIGVTLHYAGGRRMVPLETEELAAGFHEVEGCIRWTKGVATLPAAWFRVKDRVDVELRLTGDLLYPREMPADTIAEFPERRMIGSARVA